MSEFDIVIIYIGIKGDKMKKIILILSLIIAVNMPVFSAEYGKTKSSFKYPKHSHYESSYQHVWCRLHNGTEEYENNDFTKVDCLTDTHAVEFDFANKWAESVGQAEYYALKTGKRGKVVLILENSKKDFIYYYRVKKLSEKYNFDAEFITPEILNLKDGKCPYADCKCLIKIKFKEGVLF